VSAHSRAQAPKPERIVRKMARIEDAFTAFNFEGRVAVVVGAGPGLGATLGRRFAAAGASVALVARSARSLDAAGAAARSAGGDVLTIAADVSSPADAERMANEILGRFGRADVLVNAAFPVTAKRHLLDMDGPALEDWRRAVEVGGYGTLLACRFLAPDMVARGSGAIVNITSMSSRIGFAGRSEYSAGKAQAHKIAHALADEFGPHGVRVNCVAPGHIWSDQIEHWYRSQAQARGTDLETVLAEYTKEIALRRIVTEDEVANAVLFLASDLASGITGAVLDVNAGHLFTP
jgi:NAD(P)-dependent dehydrogenase (short-subunit alcohol dehydrogenase family)